MTSFLATAVMMALCGFLVDLHWSDPHGLDHGDHSKPGSLLGGNQQLGVTYEFSQTGDRRTVWYTANKRRPKMLTVGIVTQSELIMYCPMGVSVKMKM